MTDPAPVPEMHTEYCTHPIDADARFCPKCGWEARTVQPDPPRATTIAKTLTARMQRWLEPAVDDESRCAICAWPLMTDEGPDLGCVRGNCSMRPFPRRYYSLERAMREYGAVLPPQTPDSLTFSLSADEVRAVLAQQSEIDRLSALLERSQQEQEKNAKARQLVDDIKRDYVDDNTKAAVEVCDDCGPMVMCAFHSLLSLLDNEAPWTPSAIERHDVKRHGQDLAKLHAAEASLASLRAHIETLLARWDELYPAPKPGDIFQNRAVQEQYIHDALEPLRTLLPALPERS